LLPSANHSVRTGAAVCYRLQITLCVQVPPFVTVCKSLCLAPASPCADSNASTELYEKVSNAITTIIVLAIAMKVLESRQSMREAAWRHCVCVCVWEGGGSISSSISVTTSIIMRRRLRREVAGHLLRHKLHGHERRPPHHHRHRAPDHGHDAAAAGVDAALLPAARPLCAEHREHAA